MKQTNNAIKFLMAQYRAIFKNANIAMVAAMAAAALAAGQAQAATESFNNTELGKLAAATEIKVTGDGAKDGESKKIELTGGANDKGVTHTIIISAGAANNTIKGTADSADVNLSASSLKIAGATKDAAKLTIGDGTQTTKVNLKKLDVSKSGTLALTAKADAQSGEGTFVNAETIVLGGGEQPASGDITVTLDKNTSLSGTESLTIKTGAAVTVSGGATLGGGAITVEDGSITLGTASNTDTVGVLSTTGKLDIKGGEVSVAAGGSAKISGQTIDLAGTLTNAGTLSVSGLLTAKDQSTVANSESVTFENGLAADSGSTINNNTDDKTITLKGTSTFAEGATVSNSGDLVVEGTATFNSAAANITAGTDSALKVVSGGTAKMSSAVFKKFLNGKVQSAAGTSGTITLTDSGDVALGTAGIFDSSNGNMSGNLGVAGQGELKITADKAKFEGADAVSGAAANAGVTLAFNELTLGKGNAFVVKGVNLEVAKDIKIKSNKGLTLQNDASLTLDGTGKALDLESITLGETTTPSSGSLNVASGEWGVKTLTVTKGKAIVAKDAQLNVTKSLTTTDASGKLEINGGTVNAKDVETLKLNANGASITNAGKLILSAGKVVKSDFTLDSGNYAKSAVDGTTDAQISLLDDSGKAISMTLEQFKQFRIDTGFKGLFDINLKDKPTTQPQMGLGGTGVVAGVTNGYENVQGKVDSTGVNDNYFVGNAVVQGGDTVALKDGGALTLSNANANNAKGQYVTDKDGGVGKVNFEANNTLVLGGTGGKIGSVTATNNGSGSVTIADGANVEVVKDSFGDSTNALGTVNIKDGAQLNVKSGSVFTNDLNVGKGGYVFASGDVVVKETATIMGDVDAGKLSLESASTIAGGAKVDVATLELGNATSSLTIGKDKVDNEPSSTAAVFAETLMFKAGKIFVDPAYTEKASVLAVQEIKGGENKEDVGVLAGGLYVGQNAAFGYGFDEAEFNSVMAKYLVNGKFANPEVAGSTDPANALVLNKPLSVKHDNGIIVKYDITDATVNGNIPKNSLELGKNAALIITENAVAGGKAAITFGSGVTDAAGSAYTATVTADESAVISLVGDFNAKSTNIKLFDTVTNGAGAGSLSITKDINVEALGGLVVGTLSSGSDGTLTNLEVSGNAKTLAYAGVSRPVGDFFLGLASGDYVVDSTQAGHKFVTAVADTAGGFKVVDTAAHAATYAGAQQAAVASVTTMADAMFGRVGAVGVEAASISATGSQANGGVWLTPMYKSMDSDGFNAEGASYGSDVDLGGVAFGADTVNGNMRFGAVFNIGSGDSDGKGQGNGLKDEFDYYGFGIYSAMGFGNLALVGDASMTVISHEVEGLGLRGKADTSAVTMGLTGQYTVATPAVDVTPHLGARFIRLNTDSYDLIGADGAIATTDFDVQNVFSVPLGVTLSKAFVAGGWSLAPSADLTVAFNTGDTEAKSTTTFSGIGHGINLNTEVLDEVQYGVTLGLGAQYGAFGTSFGINYTGSSNTDSFGVNAQARYMF